VGAARQRDDAPPELEEDIALAYRLYLRSFNGKEALDSPHSEIFFGKVLLELGAVAESELDEALRVRAQAIDLALGVSLEDVLLKKELVDQDRLARAHRIRAAAEVIHEELLFGKIASELDIVPFHKVKRALLVQSRRSFMHSLSHLLARAGALTSEGQHKAFVRLLQVHQGELMREKKEMKKKGAVPLAKKIRESRRLRPLFGTIALQHGFITEGQLEECLRDQKELADRGERRFLGNLLQRKGYLGEEEIKVIVKALEDEIANDHVEGYRIISPLGRGAMALVYAAKQMNLDRVVALKVLDPRLPFMDADFIDRFMSEAKAAARLNHPNIVQAYDVGSSNGYHYFAMEYVEGVTLRELQDECSGGTLQEQHAVFVVREVARALSHAESHRLVHRDIKPGNVMIARTGVVKLCDLGLAQQIDSNNEKDKGVIMGSPFYIAPEQIEGRGDLDSRADIYSLGATLFHLLTGHPPFTGRSPEDVCLRHLSDPVPDPRTSNPGVTQRIVQIVYRMMAKDRDDRYPTVAELVADLNRILTSDRTDDDRQHELAKLLQEMFPKRRGVG
jgi:tRNA A-37 threonylcarbamoyl transferase component Bud32